MDEDSSSPKSGPNIGDIITELGSLTEMRMIGPKKQYQQGECNDHK
jgi:hypothetical protein